ncbi:fasciclin domain-containing protein [Mucilaginibacter sp. HMF5004]|uniref:fasciclin domain-containing protein n=1 Tax=Mucilaginibacter rivuli TaxID=2857527 RepID=UPI001C5DDB52|nr:fasciclin domain-containing protein [Mucilaginibacter rivuli]MBW4889629.1 fasciclin domain-containing protein [Mucilaginibacter rivuli]
MRKLFFVLFIITSVVTVKSSFAQTTPPQLLSGIGDESDYYKYASLVRSANMDATLKAVGTYTVFAPHNAIFRNMTGGKLDSLTSDPVKLANVLKAHIVKGKFTKADIIKKLGLGKGKATFTNLLGQTIKLTRTKDNQLELIDAKGNQAFFLKFDIMDPHGVIHGIDNVLIIGK